LWNDDDDDDDDDEEEEEGDCNSTCPTFDESFIMAETS